MSEDICVIVEAAVHRIKSEISNERNNAFLSKYFQRLLIANSDEIQDLQGDSNRNLKDSSPNLGESNPNQGDSNLDQGDSSLLRSQRHQGAPQDNFEVSDKV